MSINLATKLRDLASTGIALLRVAGAVHRQARATAQVHQALLTTNAQLTRLVEIHEMRLQLELLKQGADDEDLRAEWKKAKTAAPKTVGEQAALERDQPTLSMDTDGLVLEALENVQPGSIEDRELTALVERGGSIDEIQDLLARHGLPGGKFSGALSVKESIDYDKLLKKAAKEQDIELERAVKELAANPPAAFGEVGNSESGEALGGASFGPEPDARE